MATTDDATVAPALAALGAHVGLFKELAHPGPATSTELAARTGLDHRSVREWLVRMTTAGLEYDPASARFRLPLPEDVAEETGR
jgi:DNA-binding IclR family transcriptional regulator